MNNDDDDDDDDDDGGDGGDDDDDDSRNHTTILELSAPGQRQISSKNNDASATVPPNYTKDWLVDKAEKTANLKIGVRYYLRSTHSCLASLKQ